jgi:polyisoprenoid-binding protein YceI
MTAPFMMAGAPHIPDVLHRRALLALAALPAFPARAQERSRYVFDQNVGRIGFSARHLGLFTSQGQFDRFVATLLIDPANPGTASVECVVETAHVSIPFPGATDLLRSEAYFDIARHPTARFEGQAQGLDSLGGFPITGQLGVRGITRPFRMTARLIERQAGVARFQAEGEMRRGEFGMVADRTLISDSIQLSVDVRIAV